MAALLAWGANSYGQLCLGHKEDTLEPSVCDIPEELLLEDVSSITGGGGHTMLVTSAGDVWAAGWNSSGQLGLGRGEDRVRLSKIPRLPAVTQIACGWNHTLALSKSGEVYFWGSNSFGQLGMPDRPSIVDTPQLLEKKVFNGERVTCVSAGLRHSLVVTEKGSVFGFGSNKKGQVCCDMSGIKGHIVRSPQPVKGLNDHDIGKVVAGSTHSIALTSRGEALVWGLNDRGQCCHPPRKKTVEKMKKDPEGERGEDKEEEEGVGVGVERVDLPSRVEGVGHVVDVSTGWTHTVARNSEGKVFVWGRNTYGELGLGRGSPDTVHVPTEVECLQGVVEVYCGSEHNLALSGSGSLLSWGWNEHGMCGDGTETDVDRPKPIPKLKNGEIIQFGTGFGHSFALTKCEQN